MTKIQKITIIVWLTIIALMGLIPPWILRTEGGREISRGYHLIVSSPCPVCSINIKTLFVQWIIVSAIGVAIFIAFKYKEEPKEKDK